MNGKYILMLFFICIGLCLTSIPAVGDPVYDIGFDPTTPGPLSTFTVTATVTGDNITDVRLQLEECEAAFCFFPKTVDNLSMTESSTGVYQRTVELTHDSTDNIGYWLVINDNGTWYDFRVDAQKLNLSTSSNGGSATNGKDDSDGTPGFELIVLMISLVVAIAILKRKRIA